MKIRRLILIASLLVAVAVLVSVAVISHWQRTQTTFNIMPRLAVAVQSYSRELASHGQPVPSSVTLRDLESGGYISAKDVRAFDGTTVTFNPAVSYTNLQAVLVRVRMQDGVQIVALADGSVQELPK
jgi:Flp pilus assembly protein CpaB